jgi:hypothetical protein
MPSLFHSSRLSLPTLSLYRNRNLTSFLEATFDENWLGTMDLLVKDLLDRSFIIPDQQLRSPFLDIEFNSQAKSGAQLHRNKLSRRCWCHDSE